MRVNLDSVTMGELIINLANLLKRGEARTSSILDYGQVVHNNAIVH